MRNITIILADIESVSPLFISDGEDILIDEEMAYIPATSLAGAFRAYLNSIDKDCIKLFGIQTEDTSIESSIYISDAYAYIKGFERRGGVRIDYTRGSSADGSKIDRLYLEKGLNFQLKFKIRAKENDNEDFKNMIYDCINALDKSLIRLGGNKSNGLGIFKVKKVKEVNFDLKDKYEWLCYLKNDFSNVRDISEDVLKRDLYEDFVKFIISGELTTPLLIGAPESYDPEDVDNKNIKSDGKYIIPGSSFKGALRSRIERIANYFGSIDEAKELFGTAKSQENMLSRVFVSESIIGSEESIKEAKYNRIRIDRFTGGTRNTALVDDMPVQGKIEFDIIYRKQNDKEKDDYAIGIIALALRDLGTENLPIGGGESIGRGRFKAYNMCIINRKQIIDIDFKNKTISEPITLDNYVKAVKNYMRQEG